MTQPKTEIQKNEKEKAFSSIGLGSFVVVVVILACALILSGALSFFIPSGHFEYDEAGRIVLGSYEETGIQGYSPLKILTAPVRVFASEDGLTIAMISIFLLVMSGIFNLVEKTGGIKVFIARIMCTLRDKGGPVVCVTVLIFMLFGSFFGMFEELITLLPIVIMFMLSMNMDTMMGLGACVLAACFGFSAAITNPFSVGLAAEIAGVPQTSGVWLRIVFFGIVYLTLIVFLMLHLRKITRNPEASLTYAIDCEKRKKIQIDSCSDIPKSELLFKVYATFFAIQAIILILIASIRALSGLAIPILSLSFLLFGIIAGLIVSEKKFDVVKHIVNGAVSMLPAVVLIALASSVKLVMTESGIIDTIMHYVIDFLQGKSRFVAIILIYVLILFLQIFIGSASAKIMLVMPIVMPISIALGISPALVILAYCMADGFTDVILPTNPVLLIGLSMANVSYGKWVRWTWKLQLILLVLSLLTLFFGVAIGY